MNIHSGYAQECNFEIKRTAPNSRYELINSGLEVKDIQTGLIWQRCTVGQVWKDKSCEGTATIYNWEDSLKLAKKLTGGWRVPNIKELASLEEVACNSAISDTIFPNTAGHYWSSTPYDRSSPYSYEIFTIFFGGYESGGKYLGGYNYGGYNHTPSGTITTHYQHNKYKNLFFDESDRLLVRLVK